MLALLLAAAIQAPADDGRSMYVWHEAQAIAGGDETAERTLLDFCRERGVTRLYFMASGREDLTAFLGRARKAGIAVHAMHPGDMDEWLRGAPESFDAKPILDWVDLVRKQPFAGLHLDIEPAGHALWKEHRAALSRGYLELLSALKDRVKRAVPVSVSIPHWWDRDELKLDFAGTTKPLVDHVLELVDLATLMAYRGPRLDKVLEAIDHEVRAAPGRVELALETDRGVEEEGVPLHVGTRANLEAVIRGAVAKHPGLRVAVHHFGTWRDLPER